MKRILFILFLFFTALVVNAQAPKSVPFYGERIFVSINGQDTLKVQYTPAGIKLLGNKPIIIDRQEKVKVNNLVGDSTVIEGYNVRSYIGGNLIFSIGLTGLRINSDATVTNYLYLDDEHTTSIFQDLGSLYFQAPNINSGNPLNFSSLVKFSDTLDFAAPNNGKIGTKFEISQKLGINATAANSNLFAGKDTNYYKDNWVGGGSMVYPGAGIPLSTGSAWGTSITNNSTNWNTAYGWGNHASAGYQAALISGTNIKTINNLDITGPGNIVIEGGSSMTSSQMIDSISSSQQMPVSLKIPFTKPLGEITPYQMTGNTILLADTANTINGASTTYQIRGADGYTIKHRGDFSPSYGGEQDSIINTTTGMLYTWLSGCFGSGLNRRFKYSLIDSVTSESEPYQLTTPTTFTATALSESEIVLSWDLESTCRYYELDSAHTSGGTWATLSSTIAKTAISYNITGLDDGQTVFFRLRKLGNGIDSLNSAYATGNATTDEETAWSPSDLGAKLLAWWPDARNTANLQIQDVNRINTWYDAVGSNDLIANSSATRSYYSVTEGSKGQSTSRLTATYTSNIPRWRWFKYKLNTFTSFNGIMDGGTNWTALLNHTSITALQLSCSGGTPIARTGNNANWNVVGVYINTTGNNSRLIVNGNEITGSQPFPSNIGGMTLHSWGGGSYNSDSDFIEIFETDSSIDATDIANITTYLNNL